MTRIDIKMMNSTELRELRSMIREELDFRAEIGKKNTNNWENEGGMTLPYVDDNTPREELDSWTKTTAKTTAKGVAAKERI